MGSRLIGLMSVVCCWLLVGCGCGSKPADEAAAFESKAAEAVQTSEKPTTKEPKLEINPNYQGR